TGANNGSAGTIYSQENNGKSGRLTIDNNGLSATNTVFALQSAYLSGDLILSGSAVATPSSSSVTIGGLLVKSNSWLIYSNANNSISSISVNSNATIEAGAGILLNGNGNPAGRGPGAGRQQSGSGAGYGGYGGDSVISCGGGNCHGSFSASTD